MGIPDSRKVEQERLELEARRDFQEEIAQLREKWNIPPGGFWPTKKKEDSEKAGKELENWYMWLAKISDEKNTERFEKFKKLAEKEKAFYERLKSKSEDDALIYRQIQKEEKELNLNLPTIPLNDFYKDMVNLRLKFNLPDKWQRGLEGHLFYDNGVSAFIGPNIKIAYNKDTNEPEELWLRIYGDTTLKDIKNIVTV